MFKLYLSLVFVILPSGVFGNLRNTTKSTTAKPVSDLLSKFHQNDFKFTFERMELVRYNNSFGEIQMRTFKYNRTTPVVNASYIFKVDFGYKMEAIAQVYRFSSNEYRFFPLRCQVNVCQAMAASVLGFNKLSKFGNFTCPLLKGRKYDVYNFAPEEAKFPPFIPDGHYMLQLQMVYHDQEVFVTNTYGIIDRPITTD